MHMNLSAEPNMPDHINLLFEDFDGLTLPLR